MPWTIAAQAELTVRRELVPVPGEPGHAVDRITGQTVTMDEHELSWLGEGWMVSVVRDVEVRAAMVREDGRWIPRCERIEAVWAGSDLEAWLTPGERAEAEEKLRLFAEDEAWQQRMDAAAP